MKKRLFAVLSAVAVMAVGALGCGTTDYTKCITVGQYKGLEIDAIDTSVSDEELAEEIDFRFREDVRDGDYTNIDFTGYVDGKTFEGGSTDGKGYNLGIGSGQFIEGFEEGLIGKKIGETVTLNLKFPDPYDNNPDFAGKDVVFECTINSVSGVEASALTAAYVKENTECDTVEEYKEAIRAELVAIKEKEAEDEHYQTLYNAVLEDCEVKKYPKDLLEESIQKAKDNYQAMIDDYIFMYKYLYGYTFTASDIMSMLGITQEQLDSECEKIGQDTAKSVMAFTVIADKEGITLSDAEFEETLAKYISDTGSESADDFYKNYDYTEETLRRDMRFDKVMEFIMDNAIIK